MKLEYVLLSAILLSCFSIQARAIDPGDIAAPSISAPNMDMPTPKVSSPTMSVPETKKGPLVQPNDNSSQTLNHTDNVSIDSTQVTPVQQEAAPVDVSGKWSIKFDDRRDVSLDLTLWSSGGDKIMGYGTMMDGGAKNSVTAIGSFTDPDLTLAVKSAASEYVSQRYDECGLYLSLVNKTLSGTYVLKSGEQTSSEGNATAIKL
jgi:hypothetical protein